MGNGGVRVIVRETTGEEGRGGGNKAEKGGYPNEKERGMPRTYCRPTV